MPDDIILRPQGRVSEPSPDAAPPGSMLEAHNVVIREQGVVRHVGGGSFIAESSQPESSHGAWAVSPQFDNGANPEHLIHLADSGGPDIGVY